MTRALSILASLALTCASLFEANAAEIYPSGSLKEVPPPVPVYVPPPLWPGWYIGGNIGGAWADLSLDRNIFFGETSHNPLISNSVAFGGDDLRNSGVFGGGQIGFNCQSLNFVYGAELDLGGIGINSNERHLFLMAPDGSTAAIRIQNNGGFYGDIAGRIGYSWGDTLLYAKGGFAWFMADFQASATIISGANVIAISNSNRSKDNTITGFTVGAGWEYLITPEWSLKAEYLFFDFGDLNSQRFCDLNCFNSWRFGNNDLTVNTVKFGFNYHIQPRYVPLR